MRKLIPILFIVITILGCRKTVDPEINNSSLLIFGENQNGQFRIIDPTPDGGFVAGFHRWHDGLRDLSIRKYDQQFKLTWERMMGSLHNDQLDKILIMPNGNMLVTGIVIGYGQDTLARNLPRKEMVYFHLLNPNGKTIWVSTVILDEQFTTSGHAVLEVIKDRENNILAVIDELNFAHSGWVLKLSENGNLLNKYVFQNYKIDGITEATDHYNLHIFNEDEIGYAMLKKDETGSFNVLSDINTITPHSILGNPSNGIQGRLKHLKFSDDLTIKDYHIFANDIYTLDLNLSNGLLLGKLEDKAFNNVSFAAFTHDNHLLFVRKNGEVIETDVELNILNKFQSNLLIFESTIGRHLITKLTSGEYIVGIEENRNMHLLRFNSEGKIIGNE